MRVLCHSIRDISSILSLVDSLCKDDSLLVVCQNWRCRLQAAKHVTTVFSAKELEQNKLTRNDYL